MPVREAINQALDEEMTRDHRVFIIGENRTFKVAQAALIVIFDRRGSCSISRRL